MTKATVRTIGGKALKELPASHCREIGRIMVSWAYLEGHLSGMAWQILGVDPAIGRMAVREPRPRQQVELVRDLAKYKEIDLDAASVAYLLGNIERVSSKRDLVAHAIWAFVSGKYYVLKTSGMWSKNLESAGVPIVSRKIQPEGIEMGVPELKKIHQDVLELTAQSKILQLSINTAL